MEFDADTDRCAKCRAPFVYDDTKDVVYRELCDDCGDMEWERLDALYRARGGR